MITRKAVSLIVVALLAVPVSIVAPLIAPASPAAAADAANFDPGNIISDALFFDGAAMSAADVQSFLISMSASCSASTCLKNYVQATPNRPAEAGLCSAYAGSGGENAATIIAKVGAACGISQKVLLVLLQKEQSLVTWINPSQGRLNTATGFNCPDTAACDPAFASFFYQVYFAARQYKVYALHPTWWNHVPGRLNNIRYDTDASCGSSLVYIVNQATAGLYNYTPYQPNAAALNNFYGIGDDCSTYGNRNFFRIYTDWFGPTNGGLPPRVFGWLDSATGGAGAVTVDGWAIDPKVDGPADVAVYIDGVYKLQVPATLTRTDVAAAYPYAGPSHGFTFSVYASPGTHEVCLFALDSSFNYSYSFGGCRTLTVTTGSPMGYLDSVKPAPGGLAVSGWTIDTDATASNSVRFTVDGIAAKDVVADVERTDLATAYPGYGTAHGYRTTVPAPAGAHTVCAVALNVNTGVDTTLGCLKNTAPTGSAFGRLDTVTAVPGGVNVYAWAMDPDLDGPSTINITIDGAAPVALVASLSRSDLAAAYPEYGPAHGLLSDVPASAGAHNVCAVAVNVGGGSNANLGCKMVTVLSGNPIGYVDGASGVGGGIAVDGWAIDPDLATGAEVQFLVDGAPASTVTADSSRADLIKPYPGYGPAHGFTTVVPAAPGARTVCAVATNVGPGASTSLGCRSAIVPSSSPAGYLDTVASAPGGVRVVGWTIDPDSDSALGVRVTVDGVDAASAVASVSRPDLLVPFPRNTAAHGFIVDAPATAGTHTVCVVAVNVAAGSDSTLGCRSVTVVAGAPFGYSDSVRGGKQSITVDGWAIDPDSDAAVTMQFTIDGGTPVTAVAQNSRPDLPGAFPGYGALHGYRAVLTAAAGTRSVCITAVNQAAGTDTQLGCTAVVVQP